MEELKLSIVKTLYRDVFPFLKNEKMTLFLIGAHTSVKTSVRFRLREELKKRRLFDRHYEIYYPEEIFADLLYNSKLDLLSLENLLANSVHVVVICVESSGSIAELGAFANNDLLSKKLIVIADQKHKKAKSFIRKGPIHFLQLKSNPVLWFDFKKGDIKEFADKARVQISKVGRNNSIERNLKNPIVVADFLLTIIYTLGPLSGIELTKFVLKLESIKPKEAVTIGKSALNALFKQRAVFLQDGRYILTRNGYDWLMNALPKKNRTQILSTIDSLRVEFLNKSLRKCK